MLIGRVCPIETRTLDISEGTEDVKAAMEAQLPAGWEITSVRDRTIARVDGVQEIEADDMSALEARVPEGMQLLSVRRV